MKQWHDLLTLNDVQVLGNLLVRPHTKNQGAYAAPLAK
jgi:hypothetical protein